MAYVRCCPLPRACSLAGSRSEAAAGVETALGLSLVRESQATKHSRVTASKKPVRNRIQSPPRSYNPEQAAKFQCVGAGSGPFTIGSPDRLKLASFVRSQSESCRELRRCTQPKRRRREEML